MAETWDEEQLIADGFERVYVELEWYDGPRAGLADVDGKPHYFQSDSYAHTDEADEYRVWPASEDAVKWEREQWALFTRWNQRYEAETVTSESNPSRGGIDARYDKLDRLLAPHRQEPDTTRRLVGEMRFDRRSLPGRGAGLLVPVASGQMRAEADHWALRGQRLIAHPQTLEY